MSYFPHAENVEAPLFGVADEVWATSETHIGMRGDFTVNRVTYRVRLDLHYRDGAWQMGHSADDWSSKFHALMASRTDWLESKSGNRDVTPAAREKLLAALVPWLAEYAVTDGAEMVKRAGQEDRERKISGKREEIERLRAEAEEAEKELAEMSSSDVAAVVEP